MQAGALNKHLQPETADLVHRQEAEQEAENRRLGVSDVGKSISGKPDMAGNAAGPQLKLMMGMHICRQGR